MKPDTPIRSKSRTIIASLSIFACLPHNDILAHELVASLKQRPLDLPSIKLAGACPISSGINGLVPAQEHIFGRDPWFGTGPVYFHLAWKATSDDLATFSLQRVPYDGSEYRAKTPWVSEPSFSGAVLIRGRSLNESNTTIKFGNSADKRDSLVLEAPRAPSPSLWSFWPDSIWVPSPGCYGVQIDTIFKTDTIIFEATLDSK